MMKKIYLLLIVLLLFNISKAQVPVDSLPGIYVGQYWYANPATNPWTITTDTEYISSIDSVNCILYGYGPINYIPGGIYCTDYYSCNTCTYTLKFYNGDSIHAIYDNMIGPPYYIPWSQRFYGKRISGITGINSLSNNKQIKIYPNPANKYLTIEVLQKTLIEILNIEGQIIETFNSVESITTVDLKSFSNGVYIIKAKTDNGITVRKFIKQ